MTWTRLITPTELIEDDRGMCWAYSLEALQQARERADASGTYRYDFSPKQFAELYGSDRFSQDEYLAFLEEQGFDVNRVRADVLASMERTKQSQLKSKEKAEAFFRLFKEQWHLLNADVKKYLDEDSIYFFLDLVVADAASTKARLLAVRRHAADPKQVEKERVKECWQLWRRDPSRYAGKAAFARDMLSKFESLESQRVIERWCKEWESVPS